MRAPTPLSNRAAAIARVEALTEGRTSTLLVAPHGYGKTYVAESVGRRLQELGRTVVRFSGGSSEAAEALSGWRTAPTGAVFIVDDGANLHPSGLADLVELSQSRDQVALVTLEQERAGLQGLSDDAARRLLAVWRGGSLTRIDLPALDGFEASALADAAADGAVLDDMAKTVIVRLSNGSPRLVHELTKDALETGGEFYLPRSILSLGMAGVSPRVHDLTEPQLARLDDDGRYALVMLAKLGSVPYSRAARLLGEHQLHALLRLGLARNDGTGQDRIVADELHAWSALAEWRHSGRLQGQDRVQRTLISDVRAGGRLTPNESFVVGRYWMSAADRDRDEGLDAVTMSRILLEAAHVANVSGLAEDGRELAERSYRWQPSVAAALQRSRSLAMLGDLTEAQQALELDSSALSDDDVQAELFSWQATLDRWSERTCAQELTENEEQNRALAQRIRMIETWRDRDLHGSVGDEVFWSVLRDTAASQSSRLYSAAALVTRNGLHATPSELHELLDVADAVYRSVPYSASHHLSHAVRDASAMYVLASGSVQVLTGLSWADFARFIEEFAERAERGTGQLATTDQCVVGILGALLGMFDGRPERALADLRVVERMLDSTVPPEVHTQAALLLIGALTQTGHVEEARERRAAQDRRTIASSAILSFIADSTDFSLLMSSGRLTEARLQLRHMAQTRQKPLTERAYAACLALVAGADPAEAFAWVVDARSRELTPLQDALFRLLEAGAAGDAGGVEDAASALERVGARHRAIGAHQLAERLHTVQGRPQHARRCAERATELAGLGTMPRRDGAGQGPTAVPPSPIFVTHRSDESPRSDEPRRSDESPRSDESAQAPSVAESPPSHSPLAYISASAANHAADAAPDLSPLTRRELEVAGLVAHGLSNQEIATRLFLSVRTVESHVLQARTKVGAGRRRDLGRIVAQATQREA